MTVQTLEIFSRADYTANTKKDYREGVMYYSFACLVCVTTPLVYSILVL